MVKIVPHLWFDDNAKEAVEFYTSLIKGSKVNWLYTITDSPSGDCDLFEFEIAGKTIAATSGGPYFQLDESISFMLSCDSKEEVSRLTEAFLADGQVMMPLGEYPFSPHLYVGKR
ncbi:VOC family protein [Globicatella sulfidifaciens]|uniref:VOC family protein n=1 Tax=Globicatella sulfidifaciens TaxID=136093 RepID=UPI0028927E37|nr:VOC family protein [Globicatella sulfidifaciens]MDT2767958.1 VOC family protein [Globicatella sulfidifaciens]